jgi:hypothetical protein
MWPNFSWLPIGGTPFVRLAAHCLESRPRTEGADFGICQTFAASPAEPGELPCWFSVSAMRTAVIVVAMLAAIPALAHSWYPLACCGNMDCFPVACDQLVETISGWLYVPTGNLFTREQVQPSQDHHCHVCVGHGRDHRSICAFIVPNV